MSTARDRRRERARRRRREARWRASLMWETVQGTGVEREFPAKWIERLLTREEIAEMEADQRASRPRGN